MTPVGDPMTCVQCGHPHPALSPGLRRSATPAAPAARVFRPAPPPAPARFSRPACLPRPARLARPACLPRPAWSRPGPAVFRARLIFRARSARLGPWTATRSRPTCRLHGPGVRESAGESPDAPDRATLARWYKGFDALVAGAATSAESRAVVERGQRRPPRRAARVLPRCAPPCTPPATTPASPWPGWACRALRGRTRRPPPSAGSPPRAGPRPGSRRPRRRRPPDRRSRVCCTLPESFTTDQVRALFCALFGVDKGPSLPGVRARFGDERIHQALLTYLETGDRPLRHVVAADLDTE